MGEYDGTILQTLCKWRSWFASWQLGTRLDTDAECNAVKDHRELTILLRTEVTALTGMMIKKGIFTAEEFTEELLSEAHHLNQDYENRFPGITSTPTGLVYELPLAARTMKRMHFLP